MKILRIILAILIVLAVGYFAGPSPNTPEYSDQLPEVPQEAQELNAYIHIKESGMPVKPGNEARILWHDSLTRDKTPYSIVYLHGFSASHEEGSPVHLQVANRYGANLYLARLQAHGLDVDEPLQDFSPEGVWESAKEALQIGKALGDKVILMSTSTGGTLALMLAARYDEIAGLICYSPNIEINDDLAFLLNNPWGLQIAETVLGDKYRRIDKGPDYARYWNSRYRIESLVALQELLETSMNTSTFSRVDEPIYLAYYYKNDLEQDPVVRVSAMLRMYDQLGTPDHLKRKEAFPDVGNHVMASWVQSKDVDGVFMGTCDFLENVLKMKPVLHSGNDLQETVSINTGR